MEERKQVQFEEKAKEFVRRVIEKSKKKEKGQAPTMTQILEIIANNIDTDIKSG